MVSCGTWKDLLKRAVALNFFRLSILRARKYFGTLAPTFLVKLRKKDGAATCVLDHR